MKNLTTLIAAAAVAAGMFSTAHADGSSDGVRTATVRFADLDTTSAEGAAALFSRIRTAARNVCVDLEADRSLEGKSAYQACVHLALGNALADIDLPALNTYASGHGFVARPVKMASVR